MVNIPKANKNPRNLFKFILAILVLVSLVIFLNDSTYNVIKKYFVKNSDKYLEMYAYTKSRSNTEKYFIIQENSSAKSFFGKDVKTIEEKDIKNINCSNSDIILVYEKKSGVIGDFLKKREGQEIVLNRGTSIEFYSSKISKSLESCKVGG